MSEPPSSWEDNTPERLYVITGGRSGPSTAVQLDLVTLVVAKVPARPEMQPEHAAILRMCQSPLSVAEIAAYAGLPVSAVIVLVGDLMTARRVHVRPPVPAAQLPDLALIEAVINGLQKL
ncbi:MULTISPECIES: DUF742 domain-containing protein [unclassified Streptomyces]|uniref:DUF742 domain-containing protein n=1 Tax=unclassified Streptomyces TaxID=2593676 RepID=UPI002E2FC3C4|nr:MULTISPECIES: DUF742 domain-containing protein [unclassified Streptomyces]WUC63141.1 DUF742 domain-containing protein [Streptomyces sp. NBC_00539]